MLGCSPPWSLQKTDPTRLRQNSLHAGCGCGVRAGAGGRSRVPQQLRARRAMWRRTSPDSHTQRFPTGFWAGGALGASTMPAAGKQPSETSRSPDPPRARAASTAQGTAPSTAPSTRASGRPSEMPSLPRPAGPRAATAGPVPRPRTAGMCGAQAPRPTRTVTPATSGRPGGAVGRAGPRPRRWTTAGTARTGRPRVPRVCPPVSRRLLFHPRSTGPGVKMASCAGPWQWSRRPVGEAGRAPINILRVLAACLGVLQCSAGNASGFSRKFLKQLRSWCCHCPHPQQGALPHP